MKVIELRQNLDGVRSTYLGLDFLEKIVSLKTKRLRIWDTVFMSSSKLDFVTPSDGSSKLPLSYYVSDHEGFVCAPISFFSTLCSFSVSALQNCTIFLDPLRQKH